MNPLARLVEFLRDEDTGDPIDRLFLLFIVLFFLAAVAVSLYALFYGLYYAWGVPGLIIATGIVIVYGWAYRYIFTEEDDHARR